MSDSYDPNGNYYGSNQKPDGGYPPGNGYNPNGGYSSGEDLLNQPIDRSGRRQQEEQRFQEPEFDLQGALNKLPPIDKKTGKLIAIVIGILVVVVVLFGMLKSHYGSQKVAESYCEAVLDGEWDDVYKMMEVPEGVLMSKKHFLEAHKESKAAEVTNFKVSEGSLGEAIDAEFIEQYTAYYTVKGETSPREMDIQLIKQKEKNLFFFPKWKVSSGSMIRKNYPLSAPSGYVLVVDGETLTPTELASADTGGYDAYMENIFVGDHTITVSAENRETEESLFSVDSYDGDYYEVSKLAVNEEATEQMQSQVQDFMGKVYGEALNHSGPSESYLAFWASDTENPENARRLREDAEDLYRRLEESLQSSYYYDKIQFTSMNFSDYASEVVDDYYDEAGNFYVRLNVFYNYDYTYTATETSYQGITSKKDEGDAGSDSMSVTFKLENGEWKIDSIDLSCVY